MAIYYSSKLLLDVSVTRYWPDHLPASNSLLGHKVIKFSTLCISFQR